MWSAPATSGRYTGSTGLKAQEGDLHAGYEPPPTLILSYSEMSIQFIGVEPMIFSSQHDPSFDQAVLACRYPQSIRLLHRPNCGVWSLEDTTSFLVTDQRSTIHKPSPTSLVKAFFKVAHVVTVKCNMWPTLNAQAFPAARKETV